MKKKIKTIPKFKTYEEEAKWWDTHSFVDYIDESKEVELIFDLKQPKEDTLIIRLQASIKNRMDKIARHKGLNVSALARMWLLEMLKKEATVS